ncbi:Mut7-C ubiquitin/RNAse domain-containing protein [Streptomyces sp. RB6PN25]|uniref:Mut7-C ubiquitin/RNAse domain-containing protein n=1 Tax=Streptomyces humicola TaxID=2953240 RepID=A0ABT1PPP0_9ACTN|nr:Mut7-C ubiquitin/RNAse domain-containing protein [Streptomyces humicola]MCQ4079650.1 Mut7-C ubiquitin/RNAse domain-containing protein [Streptomyces humicola]
MDGSELRIRVPDELRLFLAARHRATEELRTGYDGTSSLGHVVQSLGVPLTEVGRLLVDGREVPASYRPADGDVIQVRGIERPQPLPPGPPRFVLDVHLGTLARRLRLLGVDAAYGNDLDDDTLIEQANTERRVLLTQDRGLLGRRALWLGAYVRGSRADEQLADVLGRFAPPLAPWTRCTACNGRVAPVAKGEVAHLLQPGTRRTYDDFARCPACGYLYWRGAHHRRLQAIVDDATRTVAGA